VEQHFRELIFTNQHGLVCFDAQIASCRAPQEKTAAISYTATSQHGKKDNYILLTAAYLLQPF